MHCPSHSNQALSSSKYGRRHDGIFGTGPVARFAFAGFVPAYLEPHQHRLGRQMIEADWAAQVLAGIKADHAEMVSEGLHAEHADVNCQVEGSEEGCAYSYANAAIFTEEQVEAVGESLKASARERVQRDKRFITAAEMQKVDEGLDNIARYARTSVSRVVVGDTGMTLCIRFGSIIAAGVFLDENADPTIQNKEGQDAIDILKENYTLLERFLQRIAELRAQRTSTFLPDLTAEELEIVSKEDNVLDKCDTYKRFVEELVEHVEDRLQAIPGLSTQAHASKIMGIEFDPHNRREIDLEDTFRKHLASLRDILGPDGSLPHDEDSSSGHW